MQKHVLSGLLSMCGLFAVVPSARAQLLVGVETDAANSHNAAVWHIDVATGDRTMLFPGGASGIAVDDQGGRVFVANGSQLSLWNYGAGPSATLLGTLVKPGGANLVVTALGFGGGRLFATTANCCASTSPWLYEVDPTTLVATPLPTTVLLSWIEALSFDASSGLFYLQHDDGELYVMDILGGGSPQQVGDIFFGPDGGSLGSNGRYFVTFDDGQAIKVYDFTTNSYAPAQYWSPYAFGLDAAGADWAPNLVPPTSPRVYCQPTTPGGPLLRTVHSGTPSASAGSGFTITHTQILANSRVQPHFSLTGRANAPFVSGIRCVRVPVFRMPQSAQISFTHALDFNAFIANSGNPALIAGQTVWYQLAVQSPANTAAGTFTLSAGVEFTILP